ncbi:MAG: FAD binding domain-containing protein, partial [Candidatus Ornithospirochaeta sp.]
HPSSPQDAVMLHKSIPQSVYLLGGTDVLRLGGEADDNEIIDINGLVSSRIEMRDDGMLEIGAAATLQDLVESPLVPEVVKQGARLCASFEKRNSATVGGNIGARRDDSYLGALFAAMGVTMHTITPHGEEEKSVREYFPTQCRRLILSFRLDPKRKAWLRRFGNTSSSHAVLIAAESEGTYALSVKGSGLFVGESSDIYKEIDYVSDMFGSAEYKKYLASTVFSLRRE